MPNVPPRGRGLAHSTMASFGRILPPDPKWGMSPSASVGWTGKNQTRPVSFELMETGVGDWHVVHVLVSGNRINGHPVPSGLTRSPPGWR